jgi:hypothetical protein
LTLRPLMTALKFADDRVIEHEVRLARAETTRAALSVLDTQAPSEASAVVRREYEARLSSKAGDTKPPANSQSELATIQSHAIAAERQALAELRTRGDIGDDAFHQLEEELDWAEVHATRAARGEAAGET